MKLFYSPASPYARKVRMLAIETGLDSRIEFVVVDTMTPDAALLNANPLGKIPTLLLDNGEALFDSPVICRYLDSLAAAHLLPTAGDALWDVLRWEALADGVMDAAYNLVMERRSRPENERSPRTMLRWAIEITRTLQHIETRLPALGTELSLAHIALGAAVGYVEFRLPQILVEAACPQLNAWYAAYKTRPAMEMTQPQ
ncbi:MAG: hypothetical protein RI964_2955 [Pseudomonadota bacterium]|jgi:glutathione S-transferase